jgi:hypothetical protein
MEGQKKGTDLSDRTDFHQSICLLAPLAVLLLGIFEKAEKILSKHFVAALPGENANHHG